MACIDCFVLFLCCYVFKSTQDRDELLNLWSVNWMLCTCLASIQVTAWKYETRRKPQANCNICLKTAGLLELFGVLGWFCVVLFEGSSPSKEMPQFWWFVWARSSNSLVWVRKKWAALPLACTKPSVSNTNRHRRLGTGYTSSWIVPRLVADHVASN